MILARSLVPLAHRALSLAPADSADDEIALHAALDAIDGFLARPVASRYLTATRTLSTLTRLRQRTPELRRLARRALDKELIRLRERQLTDDDALTLLAELPSDPGAARRLHALASLLEAHRELALRVREPETHRARIEPPTKKAARSSDRRRKPTAS